jgi:prepilin-type N-terminal cleavage/methylation domain-containing protein
LTGSRSRIGFTLIEVVMVMSIFAIGILAIMTLHVAAIDRNAKAREILAASTLLADRFERLITADYTESDLHPGEAVTRVEHGFLIEQQVTATLLPNIKKIDLAVAPGERPERRLAVTYYKRNPD